MDIQLVEFLQWALTQQRLAFSMRDCETILGLSRSTLNRMVKLGRLKSVLIGGRRLVPAAAISELLSETASKASAIPKAPDSLNPVSRNPFAAGAPTP